MRDAHDDINARGFDPMVVAVVALGFTQIISWGTTLYMPGVLGKPIASSTGWSQTLVFAGLTVGLLAGSVVSAPVGRLIDRRGACAVMSIGSVLVAIGLAALAFVTSEYAYLAVWMLLGVAMRLTLYDAAFAALVQVTPTRGRRAISYLTLFGGVASTVFWPIGYYLDLAIGWRNTLLVFAAINLFICLPLHWFGLARREPGASGADSAAATETVAAVLEGRKKTSAMILFGVVMAASAFCFGAMAAHLVPVIAATGIGAAAAISLASLKGIAQTLARLVDLLFAKNLHPINLGRFTIAVLPLSFIVLMFTGAGYMTALAFTILFGITNGLTTIVRGAVPLALFGTRGYGEILGILATPYLVLNAIAPLVFAFLEERFGMTTAIASVLAAGLFAFAAIEVMAFWYRRQTRPSA
jgi:MFS family permease